MRFAARHAALQVTDQAAGAGADDRASGSVRVEQESDDRADPRPRSRHGAEFGFSVFETLDLAFGVSSGDRVDRRIPIAPAAWSSNTAS